MGNEKTEQLQGVMDSVVELATTYPEHLQPTILRILWEEQKRVTSNVGSTAAVVSQAQPVNGSSLKSVDRDESIWDYRRELITFSKRDNLDLKVLSNPEYAAVVAFVRKFFSPDDFDEVDISVDHVLDAWRAVGRKLPTRPRDPLNDAVKKGLLDKVKGKRGCFSLSPIGENLVNDLLRRVEAQHE